MQRRLLFLDTNHLAAYSWKGRQLRAEREFLNDAMGAEAFAGYLAENANSVFSILADLPEEGFQIEEVPYVTGKDRAALTSRRLGQYFYGTPYSLAISLGRANTGRRDEKILFVALTQPRHLELWLTAMRQANIPLSGIYSAPMALASLMADAKRLKGPQLVLSITVSGVRQTFFNEGKLHFSRLTILATGSLEESAVACAVEAQKTYQYLTGQRLVSRDAALDVLVLAHPAQMVAIRARCQSSAELNFDFMDLLAEAKRAKLDSPIADSRCETLLLHELARRPPQQQFAPPAERHFYRLWQIRSALTTGAVIFFLACLLFAGKQYFSARELNVSTIALEEQRRIDQGKYDAALQSLPQLPINTEDMRTLVTRFEDMTNRSPRIETTLIPLSDALTATPGIEIQRIDWVLTDKLPATTKLVSGTFKQPPLAVSGSYYSVTEVSAQLPVTMVNDHRAMLQMLDHFVAELGKQKGLGVQIMQLPFDVESGQTIKSTGDDPASQAEAPRFSFRLIRGF